MRVLRKTCIFISTIYNIRTISWRLKDRLRIDRFAPSILQPAYIMSSRRRVRRLP